MLIFFIYSLVSECAAHLASCMGHGGRRARRSRDVGPPSDAPAASAPAQSSSPSHARLLPSPTPASGGTTPAPSAATPPLVHSPTPMVKSRPLTPARSGEPGGEERRAAMDGPVPVLPKRPRLDLSGEDGMS